MADDLVSCESLKSALLTKLEAKHVEVFDTSGGCGQSFDVIVVSDRFEGINRLQRHRLVNEAVKTEIAKLHAFSQKTFTPQQWEEYQQKKK